MPKVVSKPLKQPKQKSSFYLDAAQQIRVQPNDCVMIKPEPGGLPYIGRVKRIQQMSTDPNDLECLVCWFYRPEEARGGRKSFHGAKELFSSDHEDWVHKETFICKCKVHTLDEYEHLVETGETDFYSRFLYRAQAKTYEPDSVPVFCQCEMPYNPDQFMLCCDGCQEWYHPDCLGLPPDMVASFNSTAMPFHCPDCMEQAEQVGLLGSPGLVNGIHSNGTILFDPLLAGQQMGQQQGRQQQQQQLKPHRPPRPHDGAMLRRPMQASNPTSSTTSWIPTCDFDDL